MKRLTAAGLLVFMLCLMPAPPVYAEYMLPYPSYMPGNKLYRVSRLVDRIKKPLYFGSISRFKYHISLADKYLVEAKILFEYKQYLLAVDALARADREMAAAAPHLTRGGKEGKDMRVFIALMEEACDAHLAVLDGLSLTLPESFEWTPEKSAATTLPMLELVTSSARLRTSIKQNLPHP